MLSHSVEITFRRTREHYFHEESFMHLATSVEAISEPIAWGGVVMQLRQQWCEVCIFEAGSMKWCAEEELRQRPIMVSAILRVKVLKVRFTALQMSKWRPVLVLCCDYVRLVVFYPFYSFFKRFTVPNYNPINAPKKNPQKQHLSYSIRLWLCCSATNSRPWVA